VTADFKELVNHASVFSPREAVQGAVLQSPWPSPHPAPEQVLRPDGHHNASSDATAPGWVAKGPT